MGKINDSEFNKMLRFMTMSERFKYINDKKKLKMDPNVAPNDLKPETEPLLDWVDEERSDYDDFSDGEDGGGEESSDDSNEY